MCSVALVHVQCKDAVVSCQHVGQIGNHMSDHCPDCTLFGPCFPASLSLSVAFPQAQGCRVSVGGFARGGGGPRLGGVCGALFRRKANPPSRAEKGGLLLWLFCSESKPPFSSREGGFAFGYFAAPPPHRAKPCKGDWDFGGV